MKAIPYAENRNINWLKSGILQCALIFLPSVSFAAKCQVDGKWYSYDSPACKQSSSTEKPISNSQQAGSKAIALYMYVHGKCASPEKSEIEIDRCIDGVRDELNDEGKLLFDHYFGR